MSAFFVEWDDPATESLHQNLDKIDSLVNEELTLSDTGITLIDPVRFASTMSYIHANREDIRVTPLINNYDQVRDVWDGARVKALLTDTNKRKNIEDDILNFIDQNQLDGINIDFEELDTDTFPSFYTFLSELGTKLHARSLTLSVNVPFDNDNYDISKIAGYVDTVILMAYDQHWSGGDPGSISGIDWYENRLKTIAQTVPKEKIQIAI